MNIKISCFADRTKGFVASTVEVNGNVQKSKVDKFIGTNIKENAIRACINGLQLAKGVVFHDDLLTIEIQNRHLAEWIAGAVEYKGYTDSLDKLFELLDSIDCRYIVAFVEEPYAKTFGASHGYTKKEFTTVENLISDLEG